MSNYIAYYRTSTKDQHNGIDAQRTSVHKFISSGDTIVSEYVEHESGRKTEREQLMLAIQDAKENGYKLLIARLDRLSRNAKFTMELMESKVDFVCADMPKANSLTIGIMSLLAEEEAKRISKNTKSALKEVAKRLAKEGRTLGTNNLTTEGTYLSAHRRIESARKRNHQATKIITRMREEGSTYEAIAEELNTDGYKTPRGGNFSKSSVYILYKRAS